MSLKPLIIDLIVLKHIHISISIIRANNDIVGIVFHTMNRCITTVLYILQKDHNFTIGNVINLH